MRAQLLFFVSRIWALWLVKLTELMNREAEVERILRHIPVMPVFRCRPRMILFQLVQSICAQVTTSHWPFSMVCAYRIGTPKLEPPKSFTTANVTPITRPCRLISGPPELPQVVVAS